LESIPLTEEEFRDKFYKDYKIFEDDLEVKKFKIELGSSLIEYWANKSNLFKLVTVRVGKDKSNRIITIDKGLKNKIANNFGLYPQNLPMIITPEEWDIIITNNDYLSKNSKELESRSNYKIINYGGYLLNNNIKEHFIHNSYSNAGVNKLENNGIIKTINYLNKVKLNINIPVLTIILNLLENNASKIHEIIQTKLHPDTSKLFNLQMEGDWGNVITILQHNNHYYQDMTILYTALTYSNYGKKSNSLYLPYFIDFRGRIYPKSGYFTPQSGELSRSLITYGNKYILSSDGLEHLKKYTANCYGLDKIAHTDRLNWFNSKLEELKEIGKDGNWDKIFEAKEPLLFLACVLELQGYYKEPSKFLSGLPIFLDATCNGLQHLSSMVKDEVLAKFVNLVRSTDSDKPYDLYNIMSSRVKEEVENLPLNEKAPFANLILDRKFVKTGIMTIPYGATVFGISQQLKDQFFIPYTKDKKWKYQSKVFNHILIKLEFSTNNEPFILNNKDFYKLGKIIYKVLYESHPTLTIFVEYLKAMNKALKGLNLNNIWLSPNGIVVEQRYVEMKKDPHYFSFLGKKRNITINTVIKDKINIKKQNAAIMPNITHTLDAANISLVVNDSLLVLSKLKENNIKVDLTTIHDCFASHANHSNLLIEQVKLAFIKLYTDKDFIESYHNFILDYIQKSGFTFIEDKAEAEGIGTNGKKNSNLFVVLNKNIINIPAKPDFKYNKDYDFKDNVLASKYFIN